MELRPFALERFFAKHEFSTRFLLCSSDPESWRTSEILALEPGSQEQYLDHWLGYTESLGAAGLRTEIAKIYTTIDQADVVCFAGAEEGIYWFVHAALQSGDHAIVHTPCYQSHTELARSVGAEVSEWRATEENQWSLNIDELKRLIRPTTKVILLNSPHNPTGAQLSHQVFAEVNVLAQAHGIVVFSDEVFRECEFDPSLRLPAACDTNSSAVSLGVVSKTYGLPGLRIGWIATHNRGILERMSNMKDYTTICNSAPSEFLATIALRHRSTLAARTLSIIAGNLTLLDGFFKRYADAFQWVRPVASPMAFPKYLGGDIDVFADRLLRDAGVLLLPGTVYGDAGNHFRLGFGRKNMSEALQAVEQYLRTKHQ